MANILVAGQRELVKFILIITANGVPSLLMKCVVAAMLKKPLVNWQRLRIGNGQKQIVQRYDALAERAVRSYLHNRRAVFFWNKPASKRTSPKAQR
jgi:hypothetical protein